MLGNFYFFWETFYFFWETFYFFWETFDLFRGKYWGKSFGEILGRIFFYLGENFEFILGKKNN